MDWLSFTLGFFAFPVVGAVSLALFGLARRYLARRTDLSELSLGHRGTTLSFSSRLIGEIGERIDSGTGPAAKAS